MNACFIVDGFCTIHGWTGCPPVPEAGSNGEGPRPEAVVVLPRTSQERNHGDNDLQTGSQKSQRQQVSALGRFHHSTADDVETEETDFAHGLPLGELAPLAGEEGVGKGLWLAAKVAAITQAGGHVWWFTGEESWSRAIRPRLIAAGAVMGHVHWLCDPKNPSRAARFTLYGNDLREVAMIVKPTDPTWCLFDPLPSFLPSAKNMGIQSEAREVLDPLADFAAWTGACVTPLVHLGRGRGSIRDRVMVSAAIRQTARHMFAAVKDPDLEDQFYVGVDKSNLDAIGNADHWKIGTKTIPGMTRPVPYAVHVGIASQTIRDYALAEQAAEGTRSDRRRALVEWLRLEIPPGTEKPTAEVRGKAAALGYGETMWTAALREAGMVSVHPKGGHGAGDAWVVRHAKPRRHRP